MSWRICIDSMLVQRDIGDWIDQILAESQAPLACEEPTRAELEALIDSLGKVAS